MDDLDSDLFGSLLGRQKKSKAKAAEFDDDDPLAGLLGLSDTEEDIKPKGTTSKTMQSSEPKRKVGGLADFDADFASILPDSPRTRKPRSMMDDLLEKSDVLQKSQTSAMPQQEFVLGDKYRRSAVTGEGGVGNDSMEMNDADTQGYVPTTSSKPGTRTKSVLGSESSDTHRPAGPFAGRSGRRGISATIEPTNGFADKKPPSNSTLNAADLGSKRRSELDTNWLDPKSMVPTHRGRATTTAEHTGSRSATGKIDWLDADNGDQSPNVLTNKAVAEEVPSQTKEDDSFLNWLNRAKPSETVSNAPQLPEKISKNPSSSAVLINTVQQDASGKISLPSTEYGLDVTGLTADYEARLSSFRTKMAEMHLKFSEESLNSSANVFDLQTRVRRLDFERDQLQRAFEGLEKRHREELDALESSFKKRIQLTEESYTRREQRLQEEVQLLTDAQVEKQNSWERERSDLVAAWQRKLDDAINDRMNDLDRLKEAHGRTLVDMKRDHEVAIGRLQKIKTLEVDAMSEATSHSKTLQLVIEQLRSNTTELGQLQLKVEGGHASSLEERELLLETKDRHLKSVQDQLQKQREQNEQERTSLRQLIAQLEEKLRGQTVVTEEERWLVSQERSKLDIERNLFEESKKAMTARLDKDKMQLQQARERFLAEQKEILRNAYNDSQQLTSIDLAKATDESYSFESIKSKLEAESKLKALQDERRRLDEQTARLKSERQSLDRRQLQLEAEQSAMNALAMKVKQRSEEIEEMCVSASETREEGYAALQEAKRLQQEVFRRQEAIAAQTEVLKNREYQLAKDRLSSVGRRLCYKCRSNGAVAASPSETAFEAKGGEEPVVKSLETMFLAWQIAGRKDQDFLNRESVYLRELRANGTAPTLSPLTW